MALFSSNGKEGDRRQKPDRNSEPGLSIIAADLEIEGALHSTGVIRIVGKVKGNVRVSGQVIVAKGGLVEGDIDATESLVAGEVRGSIHGGERIELHPTALVRGDLTAPKLIVHEGGVVVGRLRVGESTAAKREDRSNPLPLRPLRSVPTLQKAAAAATG